MSAKSIRLIGAMAVTMLWVIPAFGQTTSTALRFTADGQPVLIPHTIGSVG